MKRIALTSEKGGVGKSTLAINLAGALSELGSVILVDEDRRVQSCLLWAQLAPLPFPVFSPEQATAGLNDADFLIVDSEGRPSLDDLRELVSAFDVALLPTGTTRLEVQNTLHLWRQLAGSNSRALRVVVTKASPVGRVGQDARDALRDAGVTCLETVVRRYAAHERAAEVGGLVRDVPDSRAAAAWSDVLGVAREVMA